MNQKLIQQVQKGTHCIDYLKSKDLIGLQQVIHACFPNDKEVPLGTSVHYFKSAGRKKWVDSVELPAGLTPIPLDDFFKEEEVVQEAEGRRFIEYANGDVKFLPPTSEQPSLRKALKKNTDTTYVDDLKNNAAITLDYMGRFAEWVELNYSLFNDGWFQKSDKFHSKYTTKQLIELFFRNHIVESNNKV